MALSAKEISNIQDELVAAKRELQIEAAVARVRAVAMSMHSSSDLLDVVLAMRDEIVNLDLNNSVASTITIVGPGDRVKVWDLSSVSIKGEAAPMRAVLEFRASDWDWIVRMKQGWDAGENYFVVDFDSEELPVIAEQMVALDQESGAYFKNVVDRGHVKHLWTAVSSFSSGFLSADFLEKPEASVEGVLSRMAVAFDLAFKRFEDLENAEAQAREAQIEAAIERVRASTMAMHESSELESVVGVILNELTRLDVELLRCIMWIVDEDTETIHWWMANPEVEGDSVSYAMPFNDLPNTQFHLDAWRRRDAQATYVHEGQLKVEFDDYIFAETGMAELPEIAQQAMREPDAVHLHSAIGDFGLLFATAGAPVSDENHAIVLRFGKVFQQSYTRFLDVQLAEAQAREAQIEAAMERIRGRAMAMHESSELKEVIGTIFSELTQLDVELAHCIMWIVDEASEKVEWLQADPNIEGTSSSYEMPFNDHPTTLFHLDAWRSKRPQPVHVLDGDIKAAYDEYLFGETGLKNMPVPAQEGMRGLETIRLYCATEDFGLLIAASPTPVSDESHQIVGRFAKVFQQAYTRFKDVQLAEAQTREAQIGLAVERIRAKATAMHRSEELLNVAIAVREEMLGLGMSGVTAGSIYLHLDDGTSRMWDLTSKDDDVDSDPILIDQILDPEKLDPDFFVLDVLKMEESYKVFDLDTDDLAIAIDWLRGHDPESADSLTTLVENGAWSEAWITAARLENGKLSLDWIEPPPDEVAHILPQMASAFDLAYRRFEDLKLAEAQAREAQIEAALERVRSRTMAMRESSELAPIVGVIFTELTSLDLELSRAIIWIFEEDAKIIHWWMANPEAEGSASSYKMPFNDYPITQHFVEAWQDQIGDSVYVHDGEAKQEYDDYIFGETEVGQLSPEAQEGMRAPDAVYLSSSIGKFGTVMAASEKSISNKNHQIVQRFGEIFEQSYTRFLDVQLAEEQAHEAQIEAVLERVRGQAMAMRTSDDVREVIRMTYDELKKLNESLFFVSYYTYDPKTQEMTSWPEVPGQETLRPFSLPRIDHPFHDRYIEAFENQIPYYSCRLEYESKAAYDAVLFTESDYKNVPDGMRQKMLDMKSIVSSNAVYRNSLLQTATTEPLGPGAPALLERFVPMFDLTYTRYLDLQKAEAGAREAQIEAAIERVRGQALAMRDSNELSDLIVAIKHEINGLSDGDVWEATIFLNDSQDNLRVWNIADVPDEEKERIDLAGIIYPKKADPPHPWMEEFAHSGKSYQEIILDRDGIERCLVSIEHYYPEYGTVLREWFETGTFDFEHTCIAAINRGWLTLQFLTTPPRDIESVLTKMASVLSLAMNRSDELQEAESRTREAQIESALERIRGRALAMRSSTEMIEVADELRRQMGLLGQQHLEACAIHIYDIQGEDFESWGAIRDPKGEQSISNEIRLFPRKGVAALEEALVKYHSDEQQYVIVNEGDGAAEFFDMLKVRAPEPYEAMLKQMPPGMKPSEMKAFWSFADFDGGSIVTVTFQPADEESLNLLGRAAKVFDLAYRRFKDLQESEAAARDSQIELVLERIRSRAMAMQGSDELLEVVQLLFESLEELGVEPNYVDIGILEDDVMIDWGCTRTPEGLALSNVRIPRFDHPLMEAMWDVGRNPGKSLRYEIKGKEKQSFDDHVFGLEDSHPEEVEESIRSQDHLFSTMFSTTHGVVFSWQPEPLDADSEHLLERFSRIVDLAYTRFHDLQEAENSTREAKIEASLERVRARSMAMHQSDELMDVAQVLFQQLVELGMDPEVFETCGFVIFREGTRIGDTFLTQLDGSPLAYTFSAKYGGDRATREHFAAWEKGKPIEMVHLVGDQLPEHLDYLTKMSGKPINKFHEAAGKEVPPGSYNYQANFRHGYVSVITTEPQPEAEALYPRFAKVFEQAYTRFLDLEKAEAQAREAQVEASLERVRARTMAMQRSEEQEEVSIAYSEQLAELGMDNDAAMFLMNDPEEDSWTLWIGMSSVHPTERMRGKSFKIDLPEVEEDATVEAWRSGDSHRETFISKEDLPEWITTYQGIWDITGQTAEELIEYLPDGYHRIDAFFNHGLFAAGRAYRFTEEEVEIQVRFAKEFERSYQRFLDLKKAEAQTREAQIEASLERVRSAAMAMQKSEDLSNVSFAITEQLVGLGLQIHHGYVFIFRPGSDEVELHVTKSVYHPIERIRGKSVVIRMPRAGFEHIYPDTNYLFSESIDEPWVKSIVTPELYPGWAAILAPYFEEMGYTSDEYRSHFEGDLTMIDASTGHGVIGMGGTEEFSDADCQILNRFAAEFRNAYTRFQDIQRAESQAREALIEVALERVRARATAMRDSEELLKVMMVIHQEFSALGFPCGSFWNSRYMPEHYEKAVTSMEGTVVTAIMELPRDFSMIPELAEWERGSEKIGVFKFGADAAVAYLNHMINKGQFSEIMPDALTEEMLRENNGWTFVQARTTHGELGYNLWGETDPSEEALNVLSRFASVFDLAHRRFVDLQEAEQAAREAQIEAALERVRGNAMGMQKPEDLGDVSILMFDELAGLGIESLRSGISLPIDEEHYEFQAATKSSAGLTTLVKGKESINVHPIIRRAYDGWKAQEEFQQQLLEGEDLLEYYHAVFDTMPLPDWKERMKTGATAEEGFATFPFAEGWLYTFTHDQIDEAQVGVYSRFAKVFGLAYQRYHELTKAEEDYQLLLQEKSRTERALTDLQSTQKQLVEQEKLASLGALTAGIAHEIKNPLNFVNNFAEVSSELMDELADAVSQGDQDEITELLTDLKDNAEQIAKHGKRADSIVRSMMQHARGGTSDKETIDVNEFLEEYANLAWHGMRARDHGFQAEIARDFSEGVGSLQAQPQELGRVILNLLNNAFDAVKAQDDGVVTVSTRVEGEKTVICVADNGPGIPDDIRDKIFEPFFTTKATGEGTGLGLSLSYDIITKVHEGSMTVGTSKEGGAEFTITLPGGSA